MLHTDQLNRVIELKHPPQRIISLVPSQSELLWDLGLQQQLVGITKFCIHPRDMFEQVTRVGGTKNLNFDKIRALQPDLIIGNKEENEQGQIEALMDEFPVWMSDIASYEQALDMIDRVGVLCHREAEARALIRTTEEEFRYLKPFTGAPLRVLYLIWKKPYMAAGRDTFIDDLLQRMGLENALRQFPGRYPALTEEQIANIDTDIIFLSSEPYPFKDDHIAELQALQPNVRILLVDGEFFSWYGSRLQKAPRYLQNLIEYGLS